MKNLVFKISVMILSFLLFSCSTKSSLEIRQLQCENLTDPLAIDNTSPRFGWRLSTRMQGNQQTAYQILVSTDKDKLSEDQADLWNSGKVESDRSFSIKYEGKPLFSKSFYYWKVRVWDKEHRVSAWSKPARFGVGLLDAGDWSAAFIGMEQATGKMQSPLIRKAFDWDGNRHLMLLHVNSLGYHEAYINGRPITDAVLTPAVSQFNKRSLIVTYDVTELLRKGTNEIVFWLGCGWYRADLPGVVSGGPFVRAQLESVDHGKSQTILVTDKAWKSCKSGYSSFGNFWPHQFGGETVVAADVPADLTSSTLDRMRWLPVKEVEIPVHKATPQMAELNRIREQFHPTSLLSSGDTSLIYDMGKNFTGWTEIKFPKLSPGQQIRISYCDFLDEKGDFRDGLYEDYYVASGVDGERFTNKFNYKAYRYLKISNISEEIPLSDITGSLIHTDYGGNAYFKCSDEDMNAIHDMVQYTLCCLTLGGYMVDCPQIERLGYGGDGNASTQTAQTMFDLMPLYLNWMQAWSDCMREDGSMPHTAPNPYSAGGGPYWCGFIITASWASYLNYGDACLLERYYPDMQRWLGYVEQYTVDGLLKPWPVTEYRNWYLGDWATPEGIDQTNPLSIDLVANCYISVCYQTMCKIAKLLGKPVEAQAYEQRYKEINDLVHRTFYDKEQKSYSTGTQIDLIYPMLVGATPEEDLQDVMKTLYDVTGKRFKGHLATGLVGIPVITEWAVKNDQADFMYDMLKKRDYPSYLYMIDNGATTTWEHWNGERSHIHNCYNGIGSWFYQALGGINTSEENPGYRYVYIQPQIVKGITWVEASKDTPLGTVGVKWNLTDTSFSLVVEIPSGSTAFVKLPVKAKVVLVDDIPSEEKEELQLSSGVYRIECQI